MTHQAAREKHGKLNLILQGVKIHRILVLFGASGTSALTEAKMEFAAGLWQLALLKSVWRAWCSLSLGALDVASRL